MNAMLSRLHDRLLVKNRDQDGNLRPVNAIDNDSIRPTPVKDRTWTQTTYICFWFAATANVSSLYSAATGQSVGLNIWEALACQLGGQFLAGLLMALNGRAGAVYRIPYPVLCRSSFGTWGALWPTLNRAVMSIVWNGVNAVQGAQLVNCAFLFIPVPRMKNLVYIKVVVFYAAAVALTAWTMSLGGGSKAALNEPSALQGSEKSWAIAKFFFLGLASCGTFISNAADMQRYARKPNDVVMGQIVSFPISNIVGGILGNLIAAASKSVFGELVWNPVTTLDMLMEGDRYTPGNRAACAFISLAFVYSAVFSAIFENSIPAGNDIASLLPKYITIKRGFFICAVLSYAICPWYLLSSAAVFINFLSSYQIFLSAIAGILICDYYVLRRGFLDIPALYSREKGSTYAYWHGWNFRAFAVYLIAIAPNFYGFLNQMGVEAPVGVQRFYYVAYPTGLILALLSFYLVNRVFPERGARQVSGWSEPKDYVDVHDVAVAEGVVVEAVEANAELARYRGLVTDGKSPYTEKTDH
ncbi:hypothetical protein LQW54_005238 [Pestalotiopsis sp. IQ-011]